MPYLQANRDEMILALQEVIRCNSEEAEAVQTKEGEVYPFGRGVQEAFEKTLALGKKLGFDTVDVDHYGGHIDFPGSGKPILDADGKVVGHEKPRVMAIIGHLDVVPAGGNWDFDAYGGEVKDGYIYGRGTTDDKGPVISCLYAMKALKDAGYQPVDTIRLILGLDEETGWKGMDYYFDHVEKPDYGFTPDAEFPIINGEMGLLIFDLAKKFAASRTMHATGLQLRTLKGGTAPNSVPDHCRAIVNSGEAGTYDEIRKKAAAYSERTGYAIKCRGMGKSLELMTTGRAAHGARPWDGLNAISVMMAFLGELNFVCEEHNEFIAFYNQYIDFCLDGSAIGCGLADEPSGKLVFNVGMVEAGPEAGKLTINIRYPVTATEEAVFAPMAEPLNRYNMGLIKTEHRAPIYLALDNPLVETLLEIYRRHSGDTQSQPMVIGGGTYARAAAGVVAYGALFPGDEDRMHMKNERLSIDRYVLMTEIYAEAIWRLSQGDLV